MELVLDKPGIYLQEICYELHQVTGTAVYREATIPRFLKKVSFTHTKIQHVAVQQSEEFRAHFIADVQQYRVNIIVFLDELGTNFVPRLSEGRGESLVHTACTCVQLFHIHDVIKC